MRLISQTTGWHFYIASCFRRTVQEKTGLTCCFHLFSMPFQVAALARDFPRVHFIMGHAAWSDFSGYDLIPSAKSCENIYIETSCTVTPIIRTALDILGPGKIIFGSGFPRSNMTVEIAKIKRMSLSSEEREAIFYKNANRIWRIK